MPPVGLPPVHEQEVDGVVSSVLVDIRARMPFVPGLFKALAKDPEILVPAWLQARAIHDHARSPTAEHQGRRVEIAEAARGRLQDRLRRSSAQRKPRQSPRRLRGSTPELDMLVTAAVAAARTLRAASMLDARVAAALVRLVRGGDLLAAMLALDALAPATSPSAEAAIVEALAEPTLAEHAAAALLRRPPVLSAVPGLARLVSDGGFPAMHAQLALERWSRRSGERVSAEVRRALAHCATGGGWSRLVETLSVVTEPAGPPDRRRARRPFGRRGLRVAQVLLRGRVDADLSQAGSGDGGGVVTMVVQLARELGLREDIERSLVIARPGATAAASAEPVGSGASIVRLPFGPAEDVLVSAMWEHRVQIERAIAALLDAEPVDVAHLRYADAGTFAAARALRRAGVATVFTVAPDPHATIADGERAGRTTRRSFAEAEPYDHKLFRLRLVDDLATHSDRLVAIPRAGGHAQLERLLGRPLDRRRTTTIPEGIAPLDASPAAADPAPAIAADLGAVLNGARRGLPLIVSVGRFHPVKGFPRLVEAWAGDPQLSARFNLVIAGGDLKRPAGDERVVLDEIERAVQRHPGSQRGLALLGARPHREVERLLSIARHGHGDVVAPAGVYACASDKEEFGVAILEALAHGLAVVAPGSGGPAAYLNDGAGVLVEPGRVDTLRAGLHRAARIRLDQERAGRAAALVRERFSIGTMASALAATYRAAAEEAPR